MRRDAEPGRGAQGVNEVRDVGVSWMAGPLRLTPGGSAQARLWLPAAQRGFKVTFLGDGGEVPMASLQVLDGQGQTLVILPFIEQDN